MNAIIVLTVIIFMLFLLFGWAGMPMEVKVNIQGFMDSMEQVDFDHEGRTKLDYYHWQGKTIKLLGIGNIDYRLNEFRWRALSKQKLSCELIKVVVPDELGIQLEPDKGIERYVQGYAMPLSFNPQMGTYFRFKIQLILLNNSIEIFQPTEISFTVRVRYQTRHWLLGRSTMEEIVLYRFLLGPDLGNVWLGIDPGTNGCCIASASPLTDIIIEKTSGKDKVTPSVLTFDRQKEPDRLFEKSGHLTSNLYNFGEVAYSEMSLKQMVTFQSIKKMIGFKDQYHIDFINGKKLKLNGKLLFSILIQGVFEGFHNYVNQNKAQFSGLLNLQETFAPRRVIVTVPNNFLPSQIMELIDCVKSAGDFSEVRYVTESEAIICYYLSQYNQYSDDNLDLKEKHLLIFDMGGATINTTVARISKKGDDTRSHDNYCIKIDSKLGYGIGGDTIDYCLLKTFLHFTQDSVDNQKIRDYFAHLSDESFRAQVVSWQKITLEIKKILIDRFYTNHFIKEVDQSNSGKVQVYSMLLSVAEINDFARRITGKQEQFDFSSLLVDQFRQQSEGGFSLFTNLFFQKWVFLPIQDAVQEVINLSSAVSQSIDTVLFTGRSSKFPMITEKIQEVINLSKNQKIISTSKTTFISVKKEHLKSVVAKGACWYGVHNNAIHLIPSGANSSYGVKHTMSTDQNDFIFYQLIAAGTTFQIDEQGAFIYGIKQLEDPFKFDGHTVNFYQIMGSNPEQILKQKEKHKYVRIANIRLQHPTKEVSILINAKEQIDCKVTNSVDETITKYNQAFEMEIKEEKEEHYTWMIPQNQA